MINSSENTIKVCSQMFLQETHNYRLLNFDPSDQEIFVIPRQQEKNTSTIQIWRSHVQRESGSHRKYWLTRTGIYCLNSV